MVRLKFTLSSSKGSPQVKRLVLVDGNALLHRAYHATPPLSTSEGELVNAVYGFTLMLIKVLDEFKPDYIVVAWDLEAPTFRHEAFKGYKATRKPVDKMLSIQYKRVHEILDAFNIPQFALSGFEADDLIGALSKQAERQEKDLEIIITTGDKDVMQLINKRVKVFMPKKTLVDVGLYGEEEFALRFGFAPKNLVDYKALAGDASDNIPGVSGIGEVSATKLIQKYGLLEEIYQHLEELPERTRKLLEEGNDSAFMSKKLATIETEVPIKLDLEACKVHDFEREKVVKLFEELEFKSLIGRIPGVMDSHSGGQRPIESKDKDAIASLQHDGSSNLANKNQSTANLDHQAEQILKKMSETGMLVDLGFLEKISKQLHNKLDNIEDEIYSTIGHQVNLNSPKQLQTVLFDELKLPVFRKTKTGRSTDEETLQELKTLHPVVPLLLQYRQLFKLVSTYIDALPKSVSDDGRIHSTFNVEGAATGRVTSQDPNLQNIPIRGEMGSEIRKAFVAPKGKVLLGADYSQIELRILADLSKDENLIKAFEENHDIHTITAAKIFGISISEVSKEQRMVGKTMNFATLYGQGAHALSRQLGVDYDTARRYIEEYFEQFPKVRIWKEKVLEQAREKGYVETLWGRKRYIPELKASNHMMQAFGERAAVNHPVQGTAADMIKKAMVEISKWLELRIKSQGNKFRLSTLATSDSCMLILQVHDELLFECDGSASSPQVQKMAKMVKDKMENALKLSVPVIVDLKIGPNWGEMESLKI